MELVSKNHQKDLLDCRSYMGKLWRDRKKKKPRVREMKDRKRKIDQRKEKSSLTQPMK